MAIKSFVLEHISVWTMRTGNRGFGDSVLEENAEILRIGNT